ncbi:MAG: pantoate--beta-alanine ligase [Alphaproteobacteria bacterium]|jgi:pantoate--beta-alanine ligase
MVEIIKTIHALKETLQTLRQNGRTIGFVPTMGALHHGHGALMTQAKQETDICIVSIFVNPKQFAPHEDLAIYPRPIENDIRFLETHNVDILFLPAVSEIYPNDFITKITIDGYLTRTLEADYGVATIVTKLFMCVLPNTAYFGEKDYQQLSVIKKLVKDVAIPIAIKGIPTMRDKNGLALSSRNQYLSDAQYKIAMKLNKILEDVAENISSGVMHDTACEKAKEALLEQGFTNVDYLTIRKADSLAEISGSIQENINYRILCAAYLDNIRLIDNIAYGHNIAI